MLSLMQHVMLVNEHGSTIGTIEKNVAHAGKGQLHRAFSVYVFRKDRKELLLQQRAAGKMLWPLIWANTCCSHPHEGETVIGAGTRRLQEELGFACPLSEHDTFTYRAEDPAGRGVEHEYLTLLVGEVDDAVVHPNPTEIADWKWILTNELHSDMRHNPEKYAPWLHLGLPRIIKM